MSLRIYFIVELLRDTHGTPSGGRPGGSGPARHHLEEGLEVLFLTPHY